MRRNIDFPFLRALPGRRAVSVTAGRSVFAEGDSASDVYVVATGRIEIRRDGIVIAECGPGDLFGEAGAIAGVPHPYDAIATVATTLLVVPVAAVQGAIEKSAHFALGLAQTCADRVHQIASATLPVVAPAPSGEAAPGSASGATLFGPSMPMPEPEPATSPSRTDFGDGGSLLDDTFVPPWEAERLAAERARAEAASIDKSVPRPEAFFPRATVCPLCSNRFPFHAPRDQFIEVASRDTDLMEIHRGINLLHYAVVVCPACFFAAFPEDFSRVPQNEVGPITQALAPLTGRLSGTDFTGFRDPRLAQVSFELAIVCYGPRRASFRKVAGLYHRLAWLARQAGEHNRESRYLEHAMKGYMSVLEKGQVDEPRTEMTLTYLVAEIARRLGDTATASRWVSQLLQDERLGSHKMIAELARDMRQNLRAARSG